MRSIETRVLSSLEKVFPEDAPKILTQELTFLQGEKGAFQIAVYPEQIPHEYGYLILAPTVHSDFPLHITMVGNVPVMKPYNNCEDGRYLEKGPGLYPDPMYEVAEEGFRMPTGHWTSFMVDFDTGDAAPGKHRISITFTPSGHRLNPNYPAVTVETEVEILPATLEEQKLIYTSWFHCDGLAAYYKVPVFSEEHWEIIRDQMKVAARYGQNMILVPMFTPPLDTAVGGERLTVQTVGVTVKGPLTNPASYSFDMTLLDKFVDLAFECGFTYLEMSHLFTQWGATSCPKIMATVDGVSKRIFGWNVASTSEEYKAFLTAFLPVMVEHLDVRGLRGKAYFHLTDEPHGDHLEQYLRLKNIVQPLLKGYPIMDALSDYDYYYQGVSEVPVVATSSLKPFLEGKRPEDFWVYYCCGQGFNGLSNRFIAMPGYRTRVLGLQMYLEKVNGFLQWGYNFYNNQDSLHLIDPYTVNDGECAFPAGDPFVVYPGKDGHTLRSIRLIHFNEGLQDQRALEQLEALTDRDHVLELIRREVGSKVTFNDYPRGEDFLLKLRNSVNREIAALVK
ncbi:MAG: DUF4091 domain-containing protein [Lachnospiraceae bacterium]|nr:DUF4091 domain-containing protein [Lachnospiraceae bacterium]